MTRAPARRSRSPLTARVQVGPRSMWLGQVVPGSFRRSSRPAAQVGPAAGGAPPLLRLMASSPPVTPPSKSAWPTMPSREYNRRRTMRSRRWRSIQSGLPELALLRHMRHQELWRAVGTHYGPTRIYGPTGHAIEGTAQQTFRSFHLSYCSPASALSVTTTGRQRSVRARTSPPPPEPA